MWQVKATHGWASKKYLALNLKFKLATLHLSRSRNAGCHRPEYSRCSLGQSVFFRLFRMDDLAQGVLVWFDRLSRSLVGINQLGMGLYLF
jgi:hypothetical protein